ncbi:MAG: hypothetical protein JWO62_2425 [Acidimicrobiaceae bacterium]|nr:hypothetical protein [Acidimicrobiaceae bacterium]
MNSPERLDEQIRALVVELVEAAPPAPPSPDDRAIRHRRRRRRLRLAAATLVVAVLGSAAAASIPALVQTSPGVTRLFVRSTSTGVQTRMYKITTGAVVPYVEAELSTPRAIGLLDANATATVAPDRIAAPAATEFGTGAGGAIAVAVHAGSDVATVRAKFAWGATDVMHPVDGWAVLGELGTRRGGRLIGYDAAGKRVATAALPMPKISGEGFAGESKATFVRVTNQGVLVIGHTVQSPPGAIRWLYPYLADGATVQLGLEGIASCRPKEPTAVMPGVVIVGVAEGQPITVVVHAGSAITRVQVLFSGGASDKIPPSPARQCS